VEPYFFSRFCRASQSSSIIPPRAQKKQGELVKSSPLESDVLPSPPGFSIGSASSDQRAFTLADCGACGLVIDTSERRTVAG
jgi:hypothetical protein